MKITYNKPEMIITSFLSENVVTASGDNNGLSDSEAAFEGAGIQSVQKVNFTELQFVL